MAMELEYVDCDTDTDTPITDMEAADIVNGDGSGDAAEAPQQTTDEYFEELREIAEGNQEEDAPPLADESTHVDALENMEHRRTIAEQQHEIEVAAAKEEHFSLAVKRSELENDLKEIKADEKAALRNLRNLIKRGPNYPLLPNKINEAVAAAGERSAIQVDDAAADTTWRNIPMAPLLDGIKGMGAKKVEALIQLSPTVGDWEELRAKAGIAHKQLAEVLPKGIGGNIADEIEERVYAAMKRHSDSLVAIVADETDV